MARGNRDNNDDDNVSGLSQLDIEQKDSNLAPIEQRIRGEDPLGLKSVSDTPGQPRGMPSAGSFFPVKDPAWIVHASVIKDKSYGLGFDPGRLFDGIVASKAGIRGLYDSSHRSYPKYEGLRTNLAVLRNYLISARMDAQQLATMAEALGNGLGNDKFLKRPFTRWMDSDVANIESVGAAEMYKHLLQVQHKPAPFQTLRVAINSAFGIADRNWSLASLDATPFSPENLAAPFPAYQAPDEAASPSLGFANHYRSRGPSPGFSKA
jgi:hypothetical protein